MIYTTILLVAIMVVMLADQDRRDREQGASGPRTTTARVILARVIVAVGLLLTGGLQLGADLRHDGPVPLLGVAVDVVLVLAGLVLVGANIRAMRHLQRA